MLRAPRSPSPSRPAASTPAVTCTYFLEILSSWCHWAEPAWQDLQTRYAGRVAFHWRIALMRPADFPATASQCDWFYQRSGTHVRSPYLLNSGWIDPARAGHYEAPNLVAEAVRGLTSSTAKSEQTRLALTHAALRNGQPLGDLATAVRVAACASGLAGPKIRRAAQSAAVAARVNTSTTAFHALGVTQRPAFLFENTIGDRAVFSGTWQAAPLAATLDHMLADAATYTSHAAHHPPVPPV